MALNGEKKGMDEGEVKRRQTRDNKKKIKYCPI